MGGGNDREMIETIRSVTDLPLSVDANQGWTDRIQAVDEIAWLAEKGAVLIEQPLPKERLDDNAWVTAHSSLPVFADEAVQRLPDGLPHPGGHPPGGALLPPPAGSFPSALSPVIPSLYTNSIICNTFYMIACPCMYHTPIVQRKKALTAARIQRRGRA